MLLGTIFAANIWAQEFELWRRFCQRMSCYHSGIGLSNLAKMVSGRAKLFLWVSRAHREGVYRTDPVTLFYSFVSGLPEWWDEVMDELGWLWKELPVFMPDLYPEFYSGDAASKPADLETCTSQNASGTLVRLISWYRTEFELCGGIVTKFAWDCLVILSWMCARHITRQM